MAYGKFWCHPGDKLLDKCDEIYIISDGFSDGQASKTDSGISFIRKRIMEKIRNGDAVLYKNLKGTIYGKPRENKYKGLLYTVKIGDEYYKASANELTSMAEDQAPPSEVQVNEFQLFSPQGHR